MRVFLTGGSGLIGRRLVRFLLGRGDHPVILSRQADKVRLNPSLQGVEIVQGDPTVPGAWEMALGSSDAVVNLAGHNLFAERWSPEVKRKIRASRVVATENIVASMARAARPPKVLVQGSAIGYYGPKGDEELTESSPPGADFMAEVCRDWEAAATPAESFGTRVAIVRTGVVLAREGGALSVMTPIFKWLPGGAAPIGSGGGLGPAKGRQWMSWIHIDDIVGLFLLGLDHDDARGPINGTSPQPVRNVDFSRSLAKVVHRPFLPIGPPDALLKVVLGEVVDVIAKGQKVLPRKAEQLGYRFQFPELNEALRDLFHPEAKKQHVAPKETAAARV